MQVADIRTNLPFRSYTREVLEEPIRAELFGPERLEQHAALVYAPVGQHQRVGLREERGDRVFRHIRVLPVDGRGRGVGGCARRCC